MSALKELLWEEFQEVEALNGGHGANAANSPRVCVFFGKGDASRGPQHYQ